MGQSAIVLSTMKFKKTAMIAAALVCFAVFSTYALGGSYTYKRRYSIGSSSVYTLTTRAYHNGKFASESVATSKHVIVKRKGVPFERVTFTGLEETSKQGRKDLTAMPSVVSKVKPFYMSLAPHGSLSIPKLTVPQMTGPITDLITFWVALSPKVGADQLHSVGAKRTLKKPFGGDWASGASLPVGRDETVVTSQLVALTSKTATFKTSFLPPSKQGIQMARPFMTKRVVSTSPNNFEQVQAIGDGEFDAMWGNEHFIITETVDRKSGQIIHATMENYLKLKLRVQCDAAFKRCGPELPFSITRRETLDRVSK